MNFSGAEAAERILPIDVSGSPGCTARNVQIRRTAIQWLNDGHVIVVLTAGCVSTVPRPLARTGRGRAVQAL